MTPCVRSRPGGWRGIDAGADVQRGVSMMTVAWGADEHPSSTHQPSGLSDVQFAFNYRYFVGLAAVSGRRILDYGCGEGQTVALARTRGLDMWGADTFAGFFAGWADSLTPGSRDYVRRIENGRADYPDNHFDLVISNQVLEHVSNPEAIISDIHRVVKPGGTFIAAFPVIETWYEGHVGLYFGHRFRPGAARHVYFDLCHRLGLGLYQASFKTRSEWLDFAESFLDNSCFYYPYSRLISAIQDTFGSPIEDLSGHYMNERLGRRAKLIPPAVLRFIYHKRAGEIVRVRKSR
jgi:SAM-dependent methyltransferase